MFYNRYVYKGSIPFSLCTVQAYKENAHKVVLVKIYPGYMSRIPTLCQI